MIHLPPKLLIVGHDSIQLRILELLFGLRSYTAISAAPGLDAYVQYRSRCGHFSAVIRVDPPASDARDFVLQMRRVGFHGQVVIANGTEMLSFQWDFDYQDAIRN